MVLSRITRLFRRKKKPAPKTGTSFQGPIQPGTSEGVFRATGESVPTQLEPTRDTFVRGGGGSSGDGGSSAGSTPAPTPAGIEESKAQEEENVENIVLQAEQEGISQDIIRTRVNAERARGIRERADIQGTSAEVQARREISSRREEESRKKEQLRERAEAINQREGVLIPTTEEQLEKLDLIKEFGQLSFAQGEAQRDQERKLRELSTELKKRETPAQKLFTFGRTLGEFESNIGKSQFQLEQQEQKNFLSFIDRELRTQEKLGFLGSKDRVKELKFQRETGLTANEISQRELEIARDMKFTNVIKRDPALSVRLASERTFGRLSTGISEKLFGDFSSKEAKVQAQQIAGEIGLFTAFAPAFSTGTASQQELKQIKKKLSKTKFDELSKKLGDLEHTIAREKDLQGQIKILKQVRSKLTTELQVKNFKTFVKSLIDRKIIKPPVIDLSRPLIGQQSFKDAGIQAIDLSRPLIGKQKAVKSLDLVIDLQIPRIPQIKQTPTLLGISSLFKQTKGVKSRKRQLPISNLTFNQRGIQKTTLGSRSALITGSSTLTKQLTKQLTTQKQLPQQKQLQKQLQIPKQTQKLSQKLITQQLLIPRLTSRGGGRGRGGARTPRQPRRPPKLPPLFFKLNLKGQALSGGRRIGGRGTGQFLVESFTARTLRLPPLRLTKSQIPKRLQQQAQVGDLGRLPVIIPLKKKKRKKR